MPNITTNHAITYTNGIFKPLDFKIFLVELTPRPPLRLAPPALACPPTYITLATALIKKAFGRLHRRKIVRLAEFAQSHPQATVVT